MNTTRSVGSLRIVGLLLIALPLLTACGPPRQPAAQPAQLSDETFKEFGPYELHYNALQSDGLSPEVASKYSIQRSKNRVLLNVSLLRKDADHEPRKPADATVQVDAYNLTGQLKSLTMRRVNEGDAIYYIGDVSISGDEILVFDISATPQNETNPLKVKFKRQFFAD
jgi:hypothetical protein